MKTLTSVFALLAFVTPTILTAADFEGRIKMNMNAAGMAMQSTMSIKPGGLTRMDMDMGGMSTAMISDQNKKQVMILMPAQQMYMVHAIPDDKNEKAADQAIDGTVEKTNEHAKIAGFDTTKYIAKTKDATTEIWVTEELGSFVSLNQNGPQQRGRGASASSWEKAFKGKNAFPLKVVSKTGDGEFSMEVTSVKKETVPASEFEAPAGYQKMSVPMMPGMRR